jgi:hypothetical protein
MACERTAGAAPGEAADAEALVRSQFDAIPGLSAHHVHAAVPADPLEHRTPRVAFPRVLGAHTTIADPVFLVQDFTHLQSLSRDEQQMQLGRLVGRGEIITAIYIARQLYGGSLVEAKKMVAGLANGA